MYKFNLLLNWLNLSNVSNVFIYTYLSENILDNYNNLNIINII